ncbi:hypothetical protein [Streptomyces sp. NBC_01190]|uniref:hypothetical protein n=1 Tax=Streptomyces sp. NBC_01190 TaxID=2903767 RepID=UPI0038672C92|nr:hypothetical protein OG519_28425 [Streptomyces sp. NBC_01190]
MVTDLNPARAWVVLGGIHLLNGTAPRGPVEPIVLIQVPPQEVCVPSTTVVVPWARLGSCHVTALKTNGDEITTGTIHGSTLFPDAIAGHPLRTLVGEAAAPGLVPLCYLAADPGGGYHVYAQIQFHAEDACFVRTTREPVGAGAPPEALRWLESALAAHAAAALRLNNHQRYFRTHFAGTELEYKYNLTPQADIWAVSHALLRALTHGDVPGCRPEYRQEFHNAYFDNHMFEVTGPEAERGYASLIPTANGGHVLKRKWFDKDALARREQIHHPAITVQPNGFAEYLRSDLGLQVRAMPPFHRVRYDVQCESMATGHIYSIIFDRCSLLAAPEVVLSQCEMEYRRSRSVVERPESEVLDEMDRLHRWLLSYLSALGLTTEATFYSKLSFLRDTLAERPDLTPLP